MSTQITSGTGLRSSRTSLTTAADALRDEEVDRTRDFLRVGWIVAVAVIAATFLAPGDERIAIALVATVAVGLIGSLWMHYWLSSTPSLDSTRLAPLALVCVIAGQLGVLYVGFYSAAPLITVLGLYFFCRTENLAAAIAMYAIAALAHGTTAVLIISGAMDDPGFYRIPRDMPLEAQIAGQVVIQSGYALGFAMARLGRRASLQALEALQEATRLAAQREEQVQELRQDLDRALKIGGPGRFTGHVVGAWELGNVLGRGAMGEVYEGAHTTTRAPAAIKLLRRELLGARDYVERFFREVRAASALDSPHVVRVLEASTPEDPLPFLAMERLHGESLGDLLRKRQPLARARLLALVTDVAGVLEAARASSIVHRDIKPHNLFLTEAEGRDGQWKVLDFGVAHLGDSTGTITQGGVVGTPSYMAPEQAKGSPVDHRADVYALAAVIYRCVTGQAPFSGRDTPALLYAVVHQMPPRPGAIAPVSPQLEAVLAIGLAKSREARFQTAAELAAAYDQADRGELSESLRLRARALVRTQPWTEPVTEPTQQLPAPKRG